MPSSIDLLLGDDAEYAMEAPLAFRRERNWFLSFVMTPFQDIDNRAVADPTRSQPRKRRGR